MWAVVQGAASPTADDATVNAPNHHPCVSLTVSVFLRSTTLSWGDLRPASTGPAPAPIGLQGSSSELCRTASAAPTAVFNMLIPVSEKKFHCVNRGWRTNSWIHVPAPFIFSWSRATPLIGTVKIGCNSDGPLTTSAVNWKPWRRHTKKSWEDQVISKHHDTNFVENPPKAEARLVAKRKDAADSHTKFAATHRHLSLFADEWVELSLYRLNFWTLTQPSSSKPSSSCPKRWKVD